MAAHRARIDPSSAIVIPDNAARSTQARCPSLARPTYTTLYQQNVDVAGKTIDVMSLPLAAGNALDLGIVASHLKYTTPTTAPHMAFITLS